ncbi:MAG: hypothetical protein ACTHJY_06500 [Rhizobiaceae bacterium]
MRKLIIAFAAAAVSFPVVSAQAGGWGGSSHGNNYSSGLVNVSPAVGLGDVNLLNGISILNGSGILSDIRLSGILSGNGVLSGNGIGVGILSGNSNGSRDRGHRNRCHRC